MNTVIQIKGKISNHINVLFYALQLLEADLPNGSSDAKGKSEKGQGQKQERDFKEIEAVSLCIVWHETSIWSSRFMNLKLNFAILLCFLQMFEDIESEGEVNNAEKKKRVVPRQHQKTIVIYFLFSPPFYFK